MPKFPDVILWVHWAWLVLMVLSPWLLPWYVICLMSGIVLAMNAWNDMHCPITEWEYRLRREATEQFIATETYGREVGGTYVTRNPDLAARAEDPYICYHIAAVMDGGLLVQDYIPAEAAIDRGLALFGITLSPRAQTTLTLLVLLGAPLLAYLRKG